MRKSFKYRISLTNGQRRILEQQLEECRWVYNETLAARKRAYEERGESLHLYDTQAMLPGWKLTRPAVKLVPSQVLQNISVRVDRAFQACFRRVQAGAAATGFPRFKGCGRHDSSTYPQYGDGVRLAGARLIRSNVGAVHIVLHRPVAGTPKTVTLTRARTGKGSPASRGRRGGCTAAAHGRGGGRRCGAVGVCHPLGRGKEIAHPRFYRRDEADLQRVQQRKDGAKPAENWPEHTKQKGILAKIHERIANRRSDFAHQASRKRMNAYQVIVFEDLAPMALGRSRGMRNSILDVAWSQLSV